MFAAIQRASSFVSSFLALALPRNKRKLAVVRRDRSRQGKQVVLRQSMVAGSNEAIEHRPRAAGSADCSSRLDRAPHVANLGIEMISGGGLLRADQKVRDARIACSCESKRNASKR
jgi:hypothetical protein